MPAPVVNVDATWKVYQDVETGIGFRYPPAWQLVDDSQVFGVRLYPPGQDPRLPGPIIAVDYAPDSAYGRTLPAGVFTAPRPIVVAGLTGRRFEDTTLAVPLQAAYVEIPYRAGTIVFTATAGPTVDLTPQLEQILTSVTLK